MTQYERLYELIVDAENKHAREFPYSTDTDRIIAVVDDLARHGYCKQSEGEWRFEHNPIDDPKRYFVRIVCSCCGLKTGQVSNYCPQCGAKMKGKSNENIS